MQDEFAPQGAASRAPRGRRLAKRERRGHAAGDLRLPSSPPTPPAVRVLSAERFPALAVFGPLVISVWTGQAGGDEPARRDQSTNRDTTSERRFRS
jgi:hypothetical protein